MWKKEVSMATFVLIHGAWAGGWQWQDIATSLQQNGHQVYTPTLTGLGERVHLASPEVDLHTHIWDVVNVLIYEDLRDVLLVGYSSGGLIATGVAEVAADRIAHIIYLDALVPQDGQSAANLAGPELMNLLEETALAYGDGWRIPTDPGGDPRHTPQPIRPYLDPVTISNPEAAKLPRTFILCTKGMEDIGPLHTPIAKAAEKAKENGNWGYIELESGHTPMWTHVDELTELLLRFA
jgi:pimeloyl-ACP methyl ester carboxylesterase